MNCDVLFCGVGGQGILSVAATIAAGALARGLQVKQGEVHGMAQRGGAVLAALRIADGPIHSPMLSRGRVSLLLGLEPLESLRCLPMLSPGARIVSAETPVRNLPDYPDPDRVLEALRAQPGARLVDAAGLARTAGSARAANIVMVGAASPDLPVDAEALKEAIAARFRSKGKDVVETNLRAFEAGRRAADPDGTRHGG